MKKYIFLILFSTISFSIGANAQSCCSSKSKDKACCSKKISTNQSSTANDTTKIVAVPDDTMNNGKIEKFTVYGNCGMCKRTIENALQEVEGISKGEWNMASNEMTVLFDPEKISLDNIKQRIANVGYDSDTHRAKDEVYNKLHGCCQYERPKSIE
jgi:copper chaperone CopZ